MTVPNIAKYIDHTLLRQDASPEEIVTLCQQAKKHNFTAVCVNPSYVALAARELKGTPIKVCTVIGFPLGATTPQTKAFETREAVTNGATEVDMVINLGALKSGNKALVVEDVAAVVAAAGKAIVKVIIETGLLNNEQKVLACQLVKQAGAHFVKTCTGFSEGQATVEDIALMRQTVGPDFGVKASGKVRDYAKAQALIAAGASRIGAGYGVQIVEGEAAAR